MIKLSETPIAVIGVAGIFAGAHNATEFWDNIVRKIDCITDVPTTRWNVDDYYDPDPTAPDKTYCKRGGFIPDIDFNPLEFGLPPNILEVTDVSQLLALVVARDVLEDAGYGAGRVFDRDKVGVILGVAGGQKLITPLTSRLQYPVWRKVLKSSGLSDEDTEMIVEKLKLAYVEWKEDSFPGLLGNVIAGRIANRFDLGGANCVVDAACASSLSALAMAAGQLVERRADMMIVGGVDTDNSPFMYMCFSKTPALSKRGVSRPFDVDADGMMLGEGIGMALLKRLDDAERDGDRIYAVIKGIGESSDGKYKSIYAPRPAGQAKALRRAYADADFAPTAVGLIEAHGTGTQAGDPAEFTALREVFDNGHRQTVALGSIKSQIGHTKAAAGAAGLIKAALALHHKILPPTINVTQPDPRFEIETSAFYINTEARPWMRPADAPPRRAGVSAFGFGGTNFHIVLEEYAREHATAYRRHAVTQSVLLSAATPEQLLREGRAALQALAASDGAQAYAQLVAQGKEPVAQNAARFGFAADSLDEARQMLDSALATLAGRRDAKSWEHPKGITYRAEGLNCAGRVVALFPGQGSQYANMGLEIALNFPPLREMYAAMDALFVREGLEPLSSVVFPIPAFDAAGEKAQEQALRRTEYAQAAIGVFSAGLYRILAQAGFQPNFTAGHSFGELAALWAGGILDDADFLALVKARGKAMTLSTQAGTDTGGMLAVQAPLAEIEQAIVDFPEVVIANVNAPTQVVLAGPTAAIAQAQTGLKAKGYNVAALPVAAAFHTPLVSYASEPFARAVAPATFHAARVPVYSNTTGQPYPADADDEEDFGAAKQVLAQHILHPVIFKTQIENIHAAGGDIFVEIGPRRVVTNLVDDILGDRPHVAVALNSSRQKSSDRQLREAVIQLRVAGLPLRDIDPYGEG